MTATAAEAGVDRGGPAPTAHRRLTLANSVLGAVIVALDGTVLMIAQPSLRRDLDASLTEVQWTSSGYLIAVAGLLVFAGRLGDRFGHQRVFAWGVLGFGATSAGIGFAPGVGWVIGLRVAQGVFGALLQPATLGMLRAAFPPDRLGMPIALRTSAIGVAVAAGPLVGGVLVAQLGWRAVFFLNVVPALVMGALALAVRTPRAERAQQGHGTRPDPTGLDLPGAALLAVALAAVVHTLVGVPEQGWTAAGVLGLLVAAVCAVALVRRERRTPEPLLPPAVLGSVPVRAALGVLVAASAAMLGALFVCSFVLQDRLGMDPLRTSLVALPGGVTMVLGAPLSAVLLRRWGARPTALTGTALLTAGVLALSGLGPGSSTVLTGGGFLLLGTGFGALMVTATAVVVRHAPPEAAGVAGGLQQTAMNIGPTLGVAAATSLMPLGTRPALLLLAGVAALGAPLALRMPRPARPVRDGTRSVRNDEGKKCEGDRSECDRPDREP
ncbi:MFS transporter [Streptomyces brasiliscabiei]|uniref:MFS transporter n=1 Tax=Streptomyces brasiliscabiei TaxID=2736302 RepID=UPI001C1111A1|nr:MFS transporter [Streptomyces brasiliscabiei]